MTTPVSGRPFIPPALKVAETRRQVWRDRMLDEFLNRARELSPEKNTSTGSGNGGVLNKGRLLDIKI